MYKFLKSIVLVLGACYLFFAVHEYSWFAQSLPLEVDVTWPVDINAKSSLFWGGCGAAIFKLSSASKAGIENNGIIFFKNAFSNTSDSSYEYKKWRETPLPNTWTSEGVWLGLSCSEADRDLLKNIVDAAKIKGSYYSISGEAITVVIPSQDLVVYTYYD